MEQFTLNRQQIRQYDKIAIEYFEINSLVLMENASRAATDILCEIATERSAVFLCGPGNNGGDGLVMARHLHLRGWNIQVILLKKPEELSQDSQCNYRILTHTPVTIIDTSDLPLEGILEQMDGFSWIVDAIVGTGSHPPLRAPLDDIVLHSNRMTAKRMAVDLPSGLDCDSGQVKGAVFNADLTVSFVAFKPVMHTKAGKNACGEIRIVDIGAPPGVMGLLDESPIRQIK